MTRLGIRVTTTFRVSQLDKSADRVGSQQTFNLIMFHLIPSCYNKNNSRRSSTELALQLLKFRNARRQKHASHCAPSFQGWIVFHHALSDYHKPLNSYFPRFSGVFSLCVPAFYTAFPTLNYLSHLLQDIKQSLTAPGCFILEFFFSQF